MGVFDSLFDFIEISLDKIVIFLFGDMEDID